MTTTRPHSVRDGRTLPLVDALVGARLVDPARRDEAAQVVDRVLGGQSSQTPVLKRRLAELAGYLGGAFVVSAAAIFLTAQWNDLSTPQQVGLLAGIAVLLAGAAAAIGIATEGGLAALRHGHEPVRRRLAGVLLTGAAASAAGAVGLGVDEAFAGDGTAAGLAGFGTLAVLSLLGYLLAPTVVGQLGVAAGAVGVVGVLVDEIGGDSVTAGILVLGLGIAWLVATELGLWRELASGRVIGSALAVVGAQIPAFDFEDDRWVAYLLLALVAAAAFATYVVRPAWPYLAAGVVAVTLVVPEALIDWTDNALGPAGALLAAGGALLVASLLGFRLRKEVTEEPAP